jgi:hypothetical protein
MMIQPLSLTPSFSPSLAPEGEAELPPPSVLSIAVLPFTNLTGDRNTSAIVSLTSSSTSYAGFRTCSQSLAIPAFPIRARLRTNNK